MNVIHKLTEHYEKYNSNVFRGSYYLSRICSDALENTRIHAAAFLGVPEEKNIIFTSGATESINTVAKGLRSVIGPGDEIMVSVLEHHSNFVPWQQLCHENGAILKIVGLKNGHLDMNQFNRMLNPKVRLVAVTEISNVTGEQIDTASVIEKAHLNGSLVFIDGAQGIRHNFKIPAGCDFYCMSAHKLFGPAGTGILYGKTECLESLRPSKYGGGMIQEVTPDNTEFAPLPYRLEGGTPNYPGIIAFDETLKYLEQTGIRQIQEREHRLMDLFLQGLATVNDIRIAADQVQHKGIVSFDVIGIDSYDIGKMLDHQGIAIRTGSHCAQPALKALKVPHLIRVSPAFYNTEEDIDLFIEALKKSIAFFKKRMAATGGK